MNGNTEHTLQKVNGGTHAKKVAKEDVKNALKNVRPLVCGLVVDVGSQNLGKTGIVAEVNQAAEEVEYFNRRNDRRSSDALN